MDGKCKYVPHPPCSKHSLHCWQELLRRNKNVDMVRRKFQGIILGGKKSQEKISADVHLAFNMANMKINSHIEDDAGNCQEWTVM
jgi:hypothetical protein